jgi:uncharacterized damage-inducible protein DinB
MNPQDIQTLFDYTYWANGRILAASAKVSEAQFTAPASHSWGSLRGTLIHMLDTEYGWRMICQHDTETPVLTDAGLPTLADIANRWREEETAMRAYLASLSDADLSGTVRKRQLQHYLFHIANHSTLHRSECAVMLTDFGASPGDVDFTDFLNERL